MEDRLDALEGQTAALAAVLTALIRTLDPAVAALAADRLQVALEVEAEANELEPWPAARETARRGVAEAYLQALRLVAQLRA